jgi:hypothetical protein
MKVKIEGTKYSRDMSNRAVICTDPSVIRAYNAEQMKRQENERRDKEINTLKNEMSDIKAMLKTLIERG